jgi:hypothetical protein
VELRGRRVVAWRADEGRVTGLGVARIRDTRAVELRLTVGQTIRIAMRTGHGWRLLTPAQPPPRWTSGPRVALRVSGSAAGRASFARLWIDPR